MMNKKLGFVIAGLALTLTFDVARSYLCAYAKEKGRADGARQSTSGELA